MNSTSSVYPFPADLPPSQFFEVEVDGKQAFVHDSPAGSFCTFESAGSATLFVRPLCDSQVMTVRPWRHAITGTSLDGGFEFTVEGACNLFLEFGSGTLPLHLFVNQPEQDKPDPDDPKVRFYCGGEVHEAGRIELSDGETLYLEGGAVVLGHVYARGNGIRVRGPGVLDGSQFSEGAVRLMVFDGCRDLTVQDVVTVGTPSWNLVLGACVGVTVERVKLIGWVVSSDGIDVVDSRDVTIRDCFLRNNDDCVVVKSVDYRNMGEGIQSDWGIDVSNVLVEGCTMFNDRAGNVMEIGYELQTASVHDVTFRNIDVLAGHGEGGVFTIHNGDRAKVSKVIYEDVRVEHFYDKLIDFRIMKSRYSKDAERGSIRDVTLRNISTIEDRYNTISIIGGFDSDHDVKGVVIENLTMGGRAIRTADDLSLYTKHATNIEIR